MAKRPYFKFYVDDFLASPRVSRLTTEEVGAFLLLLLHASQIDDVSLPDNDEELAEICKISVKKFQKIRKNLEKLFLVDEKKWINEKLKKEVSKYDETVDKSRKAINKRWQKEEDKNDTDVLRTYYERNTNQNQNHKPEPTTYQEEERIPYTPPSKIDYLAELEKSEFALEACMLKLNYLNCSKEEAAALRKIFITARKSEPDGNKPDAAKHFNNWVGKAGKENLENLRRKSTTTPKQKPMSAVEIAKNYQNSHLGDRITNDNHQSSTNIPPAA